MTRMLSAENAVSICDWAERSEHWRAVDAGAVSEFLEQHHGGVSGEQHHGGVSCEPGYVWASNTDM